MTTIGADGLRPWVEDAIRALDLGRGARVLQITSHDSSHARSIRAATGESGTLLVLEPSAAMADHNRHLNGVDVVVLQPDGHEEFGRFDAVYACPDWNPGWPLDLWARILTRSLRPGGRFILDLPAASACETLENAWPADTPPDLREQFLRWNGPSETATVEALESAGLRGIEAASCTHLMRGESPFMLAEFATADLNVEESFRDSLGLTLVEQLRSPGPFEVVFRRIRIRGMR